ncbi:MULTISPECIES: response regulator [Rhizobium]|uniref:Response regulator n=1 Tax=Rhizobium rhododendri TaxID=2506430 RepID=A0ABY8ICC5_9HYPH|nr:MULTISPECIES: response regulator [Rhizobium]MBZ5758594.1 response regulator [Rhizobium sp. VS19-DR96]MBZ5764576.1 response regulator [Rhizobium sp. VS19-DR129.2]MBZ5772119.1 response regulator [Rhizobium sp. VS19-DRK62.2]MBZ5783194.1 response regulator [Rhizobium sp. VS19-DR121]MBZ5800642.1 response regulator [Rhizobium sp. VS19-DR181]
MASDKMTVLVVEDEALIRLDIVCALEDAGFEVLEAPNVANAVAVLTAHPEICAVFTDVDMPGSMDGLKLAAVVSMQWPDTKIIVTSGRCNVQPSDLPAASRFVGKPYHPETIINNLSQMLAA